MENIVKQKIIYLDNAATTHIDPEVADSMIACFSRSHELGNPSANNLLGRRAHAAIELAREQVATLIEADPYEIIWTSGATESNNLAILGAARFRSHRGRHIITSSTEHKAVIEPFSQLEKEGFCVTKISCDNKGVISLNDLEEAITKETQLVSIMHVNNETGVIQNIEAIGNLCRKNDILFHTDAAQSVGKLPIKLRDLNIDLLSFTAHKFYGPQGIGGLYIKKRSGCGVLPLFFGGEQQNVRPGTLPLHQIVGLGVASKLANLRLEDDYLHYKLLHDRLWNSLKNLEGIIRNGSEKFHFPGILNISIGDIDGESLMLALEPICVSQGSACNSKSGESSFVLKALGCSDMQAHSSIRFSFGRDNTIEDIDFAINHYVSSVSKLRSLAPEI